MLVSGGRRERKQAKTQGSKEDPPKRLGKRSLEGTVCSVAKRAQDLHALRHKASADFRGFYRCVFGPCSGLAFKGVFGTPGIPKTTISNGTSSFNNGVFTKSCSRAKTAPTSYEKGRQNWTEHRQNMIPKIEPSMNSENDSKNGQREVWIQSLGRVGRMSWAREHLPPWTASVKSWTPEF